jgi:anti-sigma-K factor RskA
MNYENPELLDRLGAEHVLGTLRGAARRRYERLCLTSAAALSAVQRWEEHWAALSGTLEPMQPSARVWANVSRELFGARSRAPRPWRRRTWQLAAAAGVIAVALFIGLMLRAPLPPPQTLAVLGTDTAHPLWRLERRGPLGPLTIRVVGPVQPLPGKAYELWALPRGRAPVSLGVLPAGGTYQRALTPAQRAALTAADKVAVSIEPPGGSPTGSPTGPIIIVTNVAAPG